VLGLDPVSYAAPPGMKSHDVASVVRRG